MTETTDPILIVGAGMAGLTAATELARHGIATVLFDKGRAPGGRMATRTIDDARFDHGAQHFSVRAPAFADAVRSWKDDGRVQAWFTSPSVTDPALGREVRHVGAGGMRRLPEHLADALDVRTGIKVTSVHSDDDGVRVSADRQDWRGAGLILTPPLPQLIALTDAGAITLPAAVRKDLEAVRYEMCLAVMARLDGPAGLDDGHHSGDDGTIAWIGDNHHKGTSDVPSVTIHSTPEFGARHQDEDPATWTAQLCAAAGEVLDATIIDAVGHRWALSRPTTTFDDGALALEGPCPVVLAGEVFAGARVEGAFLSGLAAADAVRRGLSGQAPRPVG